MMRLVGSLLPRVGRKTFFLAWPMLQPAHLFDSLLDEMRCAIWCVTPAVFLSCMISLHGVPREPALVDVEGAWGGAREGTPC